MPGIISYSSTKILVSRFCQATAEEVRSKGIDVMTWEAGSIRTKLNMSNGPESIACKPAVAACFSKIGFESRTDGHWFHELQMLGLPLFSLTFESSHRMTTILFRLQAKFYSFEVSNECPFL